MENYISTDLWKDEQKSLKPWIKAYSKNIGSNALNDYEYLIWMSIDTKDVDS